MAETSFFWDGTTVGDATNAPYTATEVAGVLWNTFGDFIIPFSHNNDNSIASLPGTELTVGSTATFGKVTVLPGAALVKGYVYSNDDVVTVDIASNASGNPRIDRVVLRVDTTAQTVRPTVIQGTPAASPDPPATISSTDVKLARVWVANGYNAASASIAAEYLYDERIFKEIGSSITQSAKKNLLPNGEFIGASGIFSSGVMDGWKPVLTPGVSYNINGLGSSRGRTMIITSVGGGEGVETTVSCNQLFGGGTPASTGIYPLFTLSGYLDCEQGEVLVQIYRVDLTTNTSTLERQKIYVAGGSSEDNRRMVIREYVSSVTDALRIKITGNTVGTDEWDMGDWVLNTGYVPINAFNHEVIHFDYPLTDASWTATAKSTGLTTINLTSNFGNLILAYKTRAVILRVRCRDSASAAASTLGTAITFHHNEDSPPSPSTAAAIVSCAGNANDAWEEQIVYVPVDITNANAPIKVYVYASGAGTLDATLEILGVVT